jgi:hypothetical protein
MNMPTYGYNPDHVAALDAGSIDQTGAYVASINWAKAVQSSKGTWGVEIQAATDDGRSLRNPVTLWTIKPDGTRIFGHDILDSLLICAGMKAGAALKPGRVQAKVWDATERKMIDEEADGYPALTGKRVGLLIQREAYIKQSGETGYRLNLTGAYHPDDMRSAGEIIAGKPAEATARKIASLRDKDNTGGQASAPANSPASPGSAAPFDDDIPF